jgi:hypothetical protein
MRRIGATPARAAMIAVILPCLAGCWRMEAEPRADEWTHRTGTIGDFRPHHVASLFESEGSGQLLLECSVGAIDFRIASGRDPVREDVSGLPVHYRLDGNRPVSTAVNSDRVYLWFRDPAHATGEDPMVGQIARARQMVVRIDWSPTDRQTMRFDVSRAGAAVERLRRECAEAGRRFGSTS